MNDLDFTSKERRDKLKTERKNLKSQTQLIRHRHYKDLRYKESKYQDVKIELSHRNNNFFFNLIYC